MTAAQRLPSSLTPLDVALATLLDKLAPVAACEVSGDAALGLIAAEMPPSGALPAVDLAAADGFAFRARDLTGASSYLPLPLLQPPRWVEAGDAMPAGCDCVVDADLVDVSGPFAQVVGEAIPGQGVRRAGEHFAADGSFAPVGQKLRAINLAAACAAGVEILKVRCPRLHLVNVPALVGACVTTPLIMKLAQAAGAAVTRGDAAGRDAVSIAQAFAVAPCDFRISVGGTGAGRHDATVEALVKCGAHPVHGLALAPGRTTAIGTMAGIPVIALPGAPDQAMAAWWTLALPVLDRLSARRPRTALQLPLARKISSGIGLTEIVLLKRIDGAWMPLASGDWSLAAMVRADGWLAVPAASEGFAAGTPVEAYMVGD